MRNKLFWWKGNKFYLDKRIVHLKENNQMNDNLFLVPICVVIDRAKMKSRKDFTNQI